MKSATRTMITLVLTVILTVSLVAAQEPAISAGEARLNAGVTLIESLTFDAPLLEEWTEVALGGPTLVYDPSGVPLFFEFPVMVYGAEAGRVKAAATPLYGAGVIAIEASTRPFRTEERLAAVVDRIRGQHPGARIVSAVPVLYQHPRQAARVSYRLPNEDRIRVVLVDLSTLEPVVERGNGEPGSVRVISTIARLSEDRGEARRQMYRHDLEVNLAAANRLQVELGIDVSLSSPLWKARLADVRLVLANLGWNEPQTRVVDLGGLKLIKQETSTWCARAVAQMIEYYHFGSTPRTQSQIDSILNCLGWNQDWVSALKTYYRTYPLMIYSEPEQNLTDLTAGDSAAQTQGLQNLQQEINHDVPFDDNIWGHARMGVGYQVADHGGFETYFYVGVYDPDPTYGGISWELGWVDGMLGLTASTVYRVYPFKIRDFVYVP